VEPPILVMSLTESPDEVERLAFAGAGKEWSCVSGSADGVKVNFSSAARATADIDTARIFAELRGGARV
jgi:hypothetical protein